MKNIAGLIGIASQMIFQVESAFRHDGLYAPFP
jgi:hypothetical protein